MNDLQQLRDSADISRLQNVRPGVPLLRRKTDSAPWATADWGDRGGNAKEASAGGLDSARPLRSGFATASERPAVACADWPGRGYGIRAPAYPGETALSWPEVEIALRGIYR